MTSATAVDPSTWDGINMSSLLTPFYIGVLVSLLLCGITILQAWDYFPNKDRPIIQSIAGIMICLDLTSAGLVSQSLYYYIIPHFGSLIPLESCVSTLAAECMISAIIVAISQTYFVWQIHTLLPRSRMRVLITSAVMILVIVTAVGGLVCATIMFIDKHNVLANRTYRFNVAAGVNKGASSLADILATATFCYILGDAKTGIKRTDSMIKTLVMFSVQRGFVITTVQLLLLVLFFASKTHTYWLFFHVNVTRLYANTFFSMLHGRENIRKQAKSFSTYGTQSVGTYLASSKNIALSDSSFKGIHVDKSVIVADV